MKIQSAFLPVLAGLFGLARGLNAQPVVDLGTAADYAVLAGASFTSTGLSVINGNLGVSPGTAITGIAGHGGGGDGVVYGVIHTADASAATAQTDMLAAYNFISAQTATVTGVTTFANTTVTPGVYHSDASLTLTGNVILSGNGIFLFQTVSTLLTDVGSLVTLANGALATNVYWQVGSSATLGGSSILVGSILANTSITLGTGAAVEGRLLAQTGTITLDGNTITAIPEPATSALLMAGFVGLLLGWRKVSQRRALESGIV